MSCLLYDLLYINLDNLKINSEKAFNRNKNYNVGYEVYGLFKIIKLVFYIFA